MTRHQSELLLWTCAIALTAITARTMHPFTPYGTARGSLIRGEPVEVRSLDGVTLSGAAEKVVARDPFRLDRRPSNAPYHPELEQTATAVTPPAPPRPALFLRGVVGGGPWQAVLEGIPGKAGGVLARVGDVFGDLRVRSITRDTVILQGKDTTWTLVYRGGRR